MAEGGVIYSYLTHPAGSLPSNRSVPAQHHTCPQCPLWHRIALRVGWAVNIVLLGAVIVLAVLVGQRPSQTRPTAAVQQTAQKNDSCEINENTTCNRTLEGFRSCLKQNLCGIENGSAEGTGCKLCPQHWMPHMDKCYWLSKENQYWSWGRDDCSRRGSHLLVIQDREELEFTQNLTGNQNPVWIGLNITSAGKKWTWVDGSPLNQKLFMVSGPAEENSCAAVKKSQIKSEICNTQYKWICQKEAVLI